MCAREWPSYSADVGHSGTTCASTACRQPCNGACSPHERRITEPADTVSRAVAWAAAESEDAAAMVRRRERRHSGFGRAMATRVLPAVKVYVLVSRALPVRELLVGVELSRWLSPPGARGRSGGHQSAVHRHFHRLP